MKTPLQAAHDLLHVMTEVGQAECYINDMRLIIEGLQQQYATGYEAAEIARNRYKQAPLVDEEFLDYWQSPASMPFPNSHKDLKLWCNDAFLAGAAAMREKAAEVADELGFAAHSRIDAQSCCAEISDAIRKLEV